VIYLAISDTHLLCSQWINKDGQPFLTSVSYKALSRSLNYLKQAENEIVSVINAGLHLIREDISFEGEQVFVTIPDSFSQSSLVSYDQDMTDNDGWAFARWTIQQRWPSDSKYEYFGRSFEKSSRHVYAIRIPIVFTEPIKMAVRELGGEAIWMGTESSTFFGLNPDQKSTIIYINKNGYQYYHYSQSIFQNGTARYLKDTWKLHATNGSSNVKDVFKGNLIAIGKLSERRKTHFKGYGVKQFISMAGVNMEGNILPKDLKEEDLYVFTAIATGLVKGVALNFFDQPGIQPFEYDKTEVLNKPKTLKPPIKKAKKVKRPKKMKKNGKGLQIILYFFFFAVIGTMLIYDKKPELFENIIPKVKFKEPKIPEVKIPEPKSLTDTILIAKKRIPNFALKSQSLISAALQTLTLSDSHQIKLLSMSEGSMDLVLLGNKTIDLPIDSIGDVLNISLRQIAGQNQFEQGYLVQYYDAEPLPVQDSQTVESFEKYLEDIQNSFLKVLDPIERGDQYQIPVIVHVSSDNYIQSLLNHISVSGNNIALEKFVYKGDSESLNQSAVFYLSIYLNSKPISQE